MWSYERDGRWWGWSFVRGSTVTTNSNFLWMVTLILWNILMSQVRARGDSMRVTTSTGVRTIATVTVRASATGACVRRGTEGWRVKPFSVPTTALQRCSRESVTRWDDAWLMRRYFRVLCLHKGYVTPQLFPQRWNLTIVTISSKLDMLTFDDIITIVEYYHCVNCCHVS